MANDLASRRLKAIATSYEVENIAYSYNGLTARLAVRVAVRVVLQCFAT